MKFIRKILAICMTMVILVSSTGFTMSLHFCGGELQNFAFFTQAESCKMEVKALPPCQHESTSVPMIKKESCCKDQTVVKESQEVVTGIVAFNKLIPDFTLMAMVASFLVSFLSPITSHFPQFHNYSPPLIERNIPVLVQSFLL